MKRSPLYVFNDQTSTGICDVPLESVVQVIDADGLGTPSMTQIIGKSTFHSGTTIQQYLDTPATYKELDRYIDNLDEISDVTLGPIIVQGDILRFDGTSWTNESTSDVAGDINLGDLQDITAPTPANDGQNIEWNDTSNKWVYATPINILNDLQDVNTTPLDEQFLAYNAGSSQWEATDIDGGGF